MSKRKNSKTLPVITLPSNGDPIWSLGHDVVKLVAEYIDHE